ncbi:MAG: hypothetical protein ACRYFX_22520 [Janthinobacterium lividum]
MSASFAKRSKKIDPRQAVREARKAAQGGITPDRIDAIHILADGSELIELKPVSIPGYTYAF